MQAFFSYYGSKWRGASRYGHPRRDLVIEPFAGSACYSVRWEAPNVRLYDVSEDVCIAWDWLINCSTDDVKNVPDAFSTTEEWLALPDGPRQVVDWNINYGQGRVSKTLAKWYLHYVNTGERIGRLASHGRHRSGCPFWRREVKDRIIQQKPLIENWSVENLSYENIPLEEAHWHVDPPYQGKPGRGYEHNQVDYAHLGEWCRNLPGAVDVCENEGADWLPFEILYKMNTQKSIKDSHEVVWRKDSGDLFS